MAAIASKDIFQHVQRALAELGFRKTSPQTCCIGVTSDISGWVGLNVATDRQSGSVEVGPMFGIHSVSLHTLIAKLRAEKYVRCNPPTIVQNAGFLMPERGVYIAVKFDHPEHLQDRVDVVRDLVSNVGLPFMRRYESLSALYESLKVMKSPSGFEERICTLEYLLGNHAEARRHVLAHCEALKAEHPVTRGAFEKFAIPFMKLLGDS